MQSRSHYWTLRMRCGDFNGRSRKFSQFHSSSSTGQLTQADVNSTSTLPVQSILAPCKTWFVNLLRHEGVSTTSLLILLCYSECASALFACTLFQRRFSHPWTEFLPTVLSVSWCRCFARQLGRPSTFSAILHAAHPSILCHDPLRIRTLDKLKCLHYTYDVSHLFSIAVLK